METPTATMEICWEWWIWRGYGNGDYDWQGKQRDPMDARDYNESTAFPAVKPAIDVFRPPRRSRRQRGWYQIKPWPHRPSDSLSSTNESRLSPAPRTASSVPPELFKNIIQKLAPNSNDQSYLLNREEKHALSLCSLVCRYWAKACRRFMVRRLLLKTREDVLGFRDLWNNPTGLFSIHRPENVDLSIQKLSGTPWIHILAELGHKRMSLSLTGPLPARWRSLRTIHQALPRSLPQSFSRGIGTLQLSDLNFPRIQDAISLTKELPDLTKLECKKVTWGALPDSLPRRRERTADANKIITMMQCHPMWARVTPFLICGLTSRSLPFVSRDDLPGLLVLAEALENVAASPAAVQFAGELTSLVQFYRKSQDGTVVLGFFIEMANAPFGLETMLLSLHVKGRPAAAQLHEERGESLADIISVAVQLPVLDLHGTPLPVDWRAVDAALSALPFLAMVILGFRSREDMLGFAQGVAKRDLPLSTERGLVRYGVRQGDRWFRAAPGTDAMQPASTHVELIDAYE